MRDHLPDSNPKTRFGVTKPGIADLPVTALLHAGLAMRDGKEKYGRTNWREHEVTASIYYEAAGRHLMAWWDREQCADDSGVHHLGHAIACAMILIDAEHMGQLVDDRPDIPAGFSDLVKALTKPLGLAVDHGDATTYCVEEAMRAARAMGEKSGNPIPPSEILESEEWVARIYSCADAAEVREVVEAIREEAFDFYAEIAES